MTLAQLINLRCCRHGNNFKGFLHSFSAELHNQEHIMCLNISHLITKTWNQTHSHTRQGGSKQPGKWDRKRDEGGKKEQVMCFNSGSNSTRGGRPGVDHHHHWGCSPCGLPQQSAAYQQLDFHVQNLTTDIRMRNKNTLFTSQHSRAHQQTNECSDKYSTCTRVHAPVYSDWAPETRPWSYLSLNQAAWMSPVDQWVLTTGKTRQKPMPQLTPPLQQRGDTIYPKLYPQSGNNPPTPSRTLNLPRSHGQHNCSITHLVLL